MKPQHHQNSDTPCTAKRNFPSIFSVPNYLYMYHNRGAILKYANKNITIRQYNSTIPVLVAQFYERVYMEFAVC